MPNSACVNSLPTDLLACPEDRCCLSHLDDGLACPECGQRYPVRDSIPCLLPAGMAAGDGAWQEKRSEMAARDQQAGGYDRMLGLRLLSRLEIPSVLRALDCRPGHRVLDAGCGTGRLTRHLARRTASLAAADFSRESLLLAGGKLGWPEAVHFLQADLCHLPFPDASFDRVASCQVLEHLPGEEARAQALRELRRVLKPDGRLALTAYHHGLISRLLGKREGHHPGGIYFHRFTHRELEELLRPHFSHVRVRPLGAYVLLAVGAVGKDEG